MEYTVLVVYGLDTIYQPEIGNIRPNQYKSINAPHQGHNGESWTEGPKRDFFVFLMENRQGVPKKLVYCPVLTLGGVFQGVKK